MKVDQVYFINLDRRQDRLEKIQKELKRVGLLNRSTRIPAVDGKTLDLNNYEDHNFSQICANFCTKSLIGCALSHISTWKKFYNETSFDNVLILEDDAFFDINSSFDNFLSKNEELLPKDFDILYLGGFIGNDTDTALMSKMILLLQGYTNFNSTKHSKKVNDLIIKPHYPLGLHGYVLSRKGAEKLLDLSKEIYNHIDIQLANNIFEGNLNAYSFKNPIIYQETCIVTTDNADYIFPVIINKILDKFKYNNSQSIGYLMNVTSYEIPGIKLPLNLYFLVALIIGIGLVLSKRFNPLRVFRIFAFFVFLDITLFAPKDLTKSLLFSIFILFAIFIPYLSLYLSKN